MPFLSPIKNPTTTTDPKSCTSISGEVDVTSARPYRKRKAKVNKTEAEVRCEVCGKVYQSVTPNRVEIWVNSGQRGCEYWTHPKSHGFNAWNESHFEKITFFCLTALMQGMSPISRK